MAKSRDTHASCVCARVCVRKENGTAKRRGGHGAETRTRRVTAVHFLDGQSVCGLKTIFFSFSVFRFLLSPRTARARNASDGKSTRRGDSRDPRRFMKLPKRYKIFRSRLLVTTLMRYDYYRQCCYPRTSVRSVHCIPLTTRTFLRCAIPPSLDKTRIRITFPDRPFIGPQTRPPRFRLVNFRSRSRGANRLFSDFTVYARQLCRILRSNVT